MSTRAEIEAQALQDRLAQEGAAAWTAYAHLLQGLELPPDSTFEVTAARMIELGIAPDEAMDWLVACEYEIGCFRAEMFLQIREAEKRKRAFVAMAFTGALALTAIGVGIYAWRKA